MIAIAWFVAIVVSIIFIDNPITSWLYEGVITTGGIAANNVLTIILNAVIIIVTAILLNMLSHRNNLSKEDNLLPILFFILFQLLNPTLISPLTISNTTTLLLVVLISLLFSCYQQGHTVTEKSFLIILIISTISLFSARILYFIPIFFIGMIQMQASSLRTISGMIVGLILPYWIIWGLGIREASEFDFTSLSITLQQPTMSQHIVACIVVMLIGLFTGFSNLMNAFNENIQTRAKNGFINILSVYTAILMIIDNAHYISYLPLLNSCVALQTCYFFTTRQGRPYNIMFYTLILALIGYTAWLYFV